MQSAGVVLLDDEDRAARSLGHHPAPVQDSRLARRRHHMAEKAVYVEKPVAIDMQTAREIQDHARQAGVITCVGYQSRYSTAIGAARKLLDGVPIGLAIAIRLGGLPGTAWWKVQNRSGGMLVE